MTTGRSREQKRINLRLSQQQFLLVLSLGLTPAAETQLLNTKVFSVLNHKIQKYQLHF